VGLSDITQVCADLGIQSQVNYTTVYVKVRPASW